MTTHTPTTEPGNADPVLAAVQALAANVEAVLKLIGPDHITPLGERQISMVLLDHVQRAITGSEVAQASEGPTGYLCRHGKYASEHWCDDLADHTRTAAAH